MRVNSIVCTTSRGIRYNTRDVVEKATGDYIYAKGSDRRYQDNLNKIYSAKNKRTIDKVLWKARFERYEGSNKMVYSVEDTLGNISIIYIGIEDKKDS